MNPQIQSMLTSLGMLAATSIATMAVTKGIIPGSDQASFANDLVSFAGYGVTALLAWLKTRQVSQPAMIKAVNEADNGVKVVASTEPAPAVTAPLK